GERDPQQSRLCHEHRWRAEAHASATLYEHGYAGLGWQHPRWRARWLPIHVERATRERQSHLRFMGRNSDRRVGRARARDGQQWVTLQSASSRHSGHVDGRRASSLSAMLRRVHESVVSHWVRNWRGMITRWTMPDRTATGKRQTPFVAKTF